MLTCRSSFGYTQLAKSSKNSSQGSTRAGHLTGKTLKSHWARGCIGNIDDVTFSTTNTAFLAEASTARRQLLRERLTLINKTPPSYHVDRPVLVTNRLPSRTLSTVTSPQGLQTLRLDVPRFIHPRVEPAILKTLTCSLKQPTNHKKQRQQSTHAH